MSADRAEFLSRLFARERPANLPPSLEGVAIDQLLSAFRNQPPSQAAFERNLEEAREWLVGTHAFALSEEELRGIEYVYRAFFEAGPDLNYSFPNNTFGRGNFPTYAELMAATDFYGNQESYLASEEHFRILGELQRNNAIVPLVGNFAGPKALRAVGSYLRRHGATVSAFYTSNVEMYLFQHPDQWRQFYENVATLPVSERSTFIRSVSNRGWGWRVRSGGRGTGAATSLSSIAELNREYQADRISGYYDVIAMSR
jgi:hypothetical protein